MHHVYVDARHCDDVDVRAIVQGFGPAVYTQVSKLEK